jgi:hypothetical protein
MAASKGCIQRLNKEYKALLRVRRRAGAAPHWGRTAPPRRALVLRLPAGSGRAPRRAMPAAPPEPPGAPPARRAGAGAAPDGAPGAKQPAGVALCAPGRGRHGVCGRRVPRPPRVPAELPIQAAQHHPHHTQRPLCGQHQAVPQVRAHAWARAPRRRSVPRARRPPYRRRGAAPARESSDCSTRPPFAPRPLSSRDAASRTTTPSHGIPCGPSAPSSPAC